jgi:hypothetical protein
LFIDIAFLFRDANPSPAHRFVLCQRSEFGSEYFKQSLHHQRKLNVPFKLDHQFIIFLDFCYDPEIDLPSEIDIRWSLLTVATVYQAEFLLERTVSLLPGPQSRTPGQALRFLKAQRSTELSRKMRRRFVHFRPLENGLLRSAAEFDKLLPGILANIETLPRRQLCGSIS